MDGPADFLQKWARFPVLPRIFHVPEGIRSTRPLTPPGTDLAIWQWEDDHGRPTAIVFQGDNDKPLWKYTFGNAAQRRHEIAETVKTRVKELSMSQSTLVERVANRYRRALDVGRSFFTEHLKFHHWRGHLNITEMANAGKRGKKVRELVVTPNERGGDARAEAVIKGLVPTLTHLTYDQAKGKMEDLAEEQDEDGKPLLNLYERILRGIDVEPAGTKISLSKEFPDGKIVSIEASPHEFHVTNSVPFGGSSGKPGLRQDTGYWSRGRQDGIVFYKWLQENMSKAAHMTLQELQGVWDQLGVKYNSH